MLSTLIVLTCLIVIVLASAPDASAQATPASVLESRAAATTQPAPSATPQRPSLSFNTFTVPAGAFEMEWGGYMAERTASTPAFLKYGFTSWLEGKLGFDAIRQVEIGDSEITSRGDLTVGVRARPDIAWDGPDIAAVAWVKAPTARDSAGSGETDTGIIGIASGAIGAGLWLDLNVGVAAIGAPGGGTLGQLQTIATLGFPAQGPWSVYVEGAWQKTTTQGDGLFFDAGLSYTASPRAVFDVAAGVGSSQGYPDWTVQVGWTILIHPGP